MKLLTLIAIAGAALVSLTLATTPSGWSTDFEGAFEQAKEEDKAVMVEFTGSDYCPPCILMNKHVFSKREFIRQASKDFVLVKLDLPAGDPATARKNAPYAEKFGVEGLPTIIVFNAKGDELSRFYATDFPGVDLMLAHLRKSLTKS